jgi:hypothetical protein
MIKLSKLINESAANSAIETHLSKYKSLQDMYDHVLKVAKATNFKSGMFGIKFHELIPVIIAKLKHK